MAVTQNSYIGNGSTTNYAFTFPYLKTSDVKAQIDATVTTAFTLANATTVQFNTAPASGAKIKIYRETDDSALTATFYAGSAIKSEDLNDNFTQNLYTTQEVSARYLSNLGGTMVGDMTMAEDVDIVFEGATDDAHETRLTVADPTADRTITIPNVTGTVITTGDTGTVTSTMLADATIVAADLASNAVTTVKITDGNVTTAKIAADAITSAKIADDQINSEHYVDGSIDTAHIADLNVTTAKIANDAITGAKIADDAVDSEHLAADSIDTEHYAPASVDTAALANTSVTTAKIANDAITGSQIADNAITSDHMSSNSVVLSNMSDNSVGTSEIVDDAVTNAKIASGAVDTSNIAGSALIVNSEQASTTGNDTTLLTSAASDSRYFKQDSTETISSGQTWTSSDSYIATTGAVNARILDLVDDVGGFKTIDNETSFPDTNPDPQNGTGTIISIKGLATAIVTGSGETTKTISNGNVSNNATITITGLTENTTYGQDMGLLVETTSTTHTYTFHRLVPPPTSITTVSNNIASVNTTAANIATVNDFADKYRIANSAPSSNNDDGDLYYNTNDNKLYVYNGTSWEVASSLNGSGGSVTGDTTFTDNTKIKFGTGEDLQIYHDGTHSRIDDTGTGSLVLRTSNFLVEKYGGDYMINGVSDGAVELYYDNVKKFETASGGAIVTGVLQADQFHCGDGEKFISGTGNDLQIYHSDPHSIIKHSNASGYLELNTDNFRILDAAGSEWIIKGVKDGSVELYHNNVKRFETTSTGASMDGLLNFNNSGDKILIPDSGKIVLGGGLDLQIYHNGTSSYLTNSTGNLILESDSYIWLGSKTSSETYIKGIKDGAVELYYNNVKKLETTSTGVTLVDNLVLDNATNAGRDIQWQPGSDRLAFFDNTKATFGDGVDLQIWHNGTHSYIANQTGNFHIEADTCVLRSASQETYFLGSVNGASKLYYDNALKFETTSTGTKITGQSVIDGDAIWNGSDGSWGAFWDQSANIVSFKDSAKIGFGTSNDLQIYHNGSSSYIDNDGGWLNINTATGGIQISKGTSEYMGRFIVDGATELYYDNSKKFETTSSGVDVTGSINATGQVKINDSFAYIAGTGNDLQIYHDGSNSTLSNTTGYFHVSNTNGIIYLDGNNTYIRNGAASEYQAKFIANGAAELYYDNSKKFETTSWGVDVTGILRADELKLQGDDQKLYIGAGSDLEIYHDGTNSYITNGATGGILYLQTYGENAIKCHPNAAVELYYDGAKQCETNSGGMNWADGKRAYFGNSSDLQIYHDGTNSILKNTTGSLYINAKDSEVGIKIVPDGAVELYHDNVKTFQTDGNGIAVYGPEGGSANIYLYADEGDDDADKFQFTVNEGGPLLIQNRASGGVEENIKCYGNGAVELFYDDVKKLETTSTGVSCPGILQMGTSSSYIDLPDNASLYCGTSDDLQIVHDGTNSIIENDTGDLKISSPYLRLRGGAVALYNEAQTETMLYAAANGAVELYYDNSKKLETSSAGTLTQGDATITDAVYLSNTSTISSRLTLNSENGSSWQGTRELVAFDLIGNGADHRTGNLSIKIKKAASDSDPTEMMRIDGTYNKIRIPDSVQLELGDGGDLQMYHSGSHSYILNGTGNFDIRTNNEFGIYNYAGDEVLAKFTANGAVELRYDNSKKFETTSGGVLVTGNIETNEHISLTGDNKKLKVGAGEDLQIYHDGTDSYLDNSTGELVLRSDTIRLREKTGNETLAVFERDGAAKLYYDNSKKFETTSSGIQVNGLNKTVKASGDGLIVQNGDTNFESVILANASGEARIMSSSGGSTGRPPLCFWVNDAERVRIQTGGGISFNGDTAAANALDDYEEGTFTITLTPGSGSYSVSHMQAQYTKVGNVCHIQGWWRASAANSVSGSLTLSGLPFAAYNNTGSGGLRQTLSAQVANANGNATDIVLQLTDNATTGTIKSTADMSASRYEWVATNIEATTAIYINGSYITT